ncbi:MAG: YdeI family protein [Ktedonobacterales bacterium]
MTGSNHLPLLACETRDVWEVWLAAHHAEAAGVWLKIAKKDGGARSVSYAEALECALCYGWIDGQKAALDAQHWLQKFTPRRPKSGWSRVNREKAQALIAAGSMRPAGLRQVEQAMADGRWEAAYESQRTISVPPDLQRELDRHPEAKAFFATLNSVNRYAVLLRIQTAKKPETRAARISKFVAMLAAHETIHP